MKTILIITIKNFELKIKKVKFFLIYYAKLSLIF